MTTPGIKPGAFGYNVNVVLLFEVTPPTGGGANHKIDPGM
jgi:hypothetical protein